jgi:hypothetical protein
VAVEPRCAPLAFGVTATPRRFAPLLPKPSSLRRCFSVYAAAGRHPLMELNMPEGQPFIPNDYELRRERGRLQLITGPNSAWQEPQKLCRECI